MGEPGGGNVKPLGDYRPPYPAVERPFDPGPDDPGAPRIGRFEISHSGLYQGWYVIPRVTTVWAAVDGATKVEFFWAVPGTDMPPQLIARVEGKGGDGLSHWPATWETNHGAMVGLVWARAYNDKGKSTSRVLSVIHGSLSDGPAKFMGVPLHPTFTWKTDVDAATKESLKPWLGNDFEKGLKGLALSDWVQEPSTEAVMKWYRERLRAAGWAVVGPAGGGSHWGMPATKGDKGILVMFAWGSGDRGNMPPSDPEKGYRIAITVR